MSEIIREVEMERGRIGTGKEMDRRRADAQEMDEQRADAQEMERQRMDGEALEGMVADEWATDEWEVKGGRKKRGRGEGRYRLTGSLGAKIVAFFLLAVSALIGIAALAGCICLEANDFYGNSLTEVLWRQLQGLASSAIYEIAGYIEQGDIRGAKTFCEGRNIDVELILENTIEEESVLWSTWDGYDTPYISEMYIQFDLPDSVWLDGYKLQEDEPYLIRVYVDPSFLIDDDFQRTTEVVTKAYDIRYMLIWAAVGGIVLCIFLFVFLMCGAGHQNGRDGIVPGVLASIHFDVLTFLFAMIAVVPSFIGLNVLRYGNDMAQIALLVIGGTLLVVWGTLYCMEFATRLKRGNCFRYTLIYAVLRGCFRLCWFLGRGIAAMLRGIPLVLTVVVAYLGLCILEFLGVIVFIRESAGVFLWAMEKVALFPVIMYIALACRTLLKAGRALAEGQGDYKVDTSRMLGEFKEHGENLNSLGQGISKAVAERLRSERLKTELITNVSHDLKTPLTSIINYADLICEESMGGGLSAAREAARSAKETFEEARGGVMAGNLGETEKSHAAPAGGGAGIVDGSPLDRRGGSDVFAGDGIGDGSAHTEQGRGITANPHADVSRIAEYAQVLLRQSRRLKKLLEDLLEASKATTGNLEVSLEPCEVGVLLSQAVGEYQQRMEEKQLDLIIRQPDEIGRIMADGRHLWRVFDNLLNNICKYAQERSRVYLSVEERDGYVRIIFRNMSKYPLDISAEELEERFVRGDKSRHMEGNGLGLSIAKSLVELQDGEMEITIDGDLFKVTLRFAVT
nr:sensor histidine kinase [uncultured Acetatifactor sp.]